MPEDKTNSNPDWVTVPQGEINGFEMRNGELIQVRYIMKELINNPKYENAEYELRWQQVSGDIIDDPLPHRFNVMPPDDLFENGPYNAWKWVQKHSIPPRIFAEYTLP